MLLKGIYAVSPRKVSSYTKVFLKLVTKTTYPAAKVPQGDNYEQKLDNLNFQISSRQVSAEKAVE